MSDLGREIQNFTSGLSVDLKVLCQSSLSANLLTYVQETFRVAYPIPNA